MIKKLTCKYELDEDYGGDAHRCEHLYDGDTEVYDVCNLNECPEDAILARDLIDSYEAARLIRLGMDYAAEGYSDIEINYVEGVW